MQSVVLDYHTTHHLTHTAVTGLASYWTARHHLNLSLYPTPPTYQQRFLIVRWVFKLVTYGYEPPVTDVSKPNKQI
jgi:hypothetical protein